MTLDSPSYTLRLLGGASIEGPEGALTGRPAQKNALTLMAVLATAPDRALPRETIMALLWPERDGKRSRHLLNVTTYEIRKALGSDALVTANGNLRLNPEIVASDIERFDLAVEAEAWDRAAKIYAGPFLDGFHANGSEAFERWVERERWRCERLYRTVCERRAERAQDAATAIERWRELLERDPASATATVGLMRALEATGRRAEAIDAAHAHRILMLDEYGADPNPDVEQLADRLREDPRANGLPYTETTEGNPASSDDSPSSRSWRVVAGAGAAALVTLSLLFFGPWEGEEAPAYPESNQILVAGFENRTGDPDLDEVGLMAADWIAQELSRTDVVSPIVPVGELRANGYQDDDHPMEAAERVGAGLVLLGHYAIEADSIAATAMIVRVPTGEVVRLIDRVTGPREDPAIVVERLRQRTTGALAAVVDDRLAPFVTTATSQPPSYEAYRRFAQGIELRSRREYRAAAAAFHRAAAYDTTFTLPLVYAFLAHGKAIYHPDETRRDQRQAELADSVAQLLAARHDDLPPWEAAWVDGMKGDPSALRRIIDMTPEPHWLLRWAQSTRRQGRTSETLEVLSRLDADDLEPDAYRRYLVIRMNALHLKGAYEAEHELVQEFTRRYHPARPVPPRTHVPELYEIRTLAALGRTAEMERRLEELMDRALDPWDVNVPLMEIMIHGHGDHEIARRAHEWILERALAKESSDDPEELWRWPAAMTLHRLGRLEEARAHYERLLEHAAPGSDNTIIFLGILGSIAGEMGNRDEALRYDDRLKALDLEPFHQPSLIHTVRRARIEIAISLDEHERAIAMLSDGVEHGMRLFRNGHPELFNMRWLELADDPAYRALVRPK